ncbi:hypothetical protein IAU59_002217 [Kwoniella sp. CBS 9459]
MSRRGFDTTLSSSGGKPQPNRTTSSSTSGTGTGTGQAIRRQSHSHAGTISPPDPSHAISHVPTHTSAEKAALSKNSGSGSGSEPEDRTQSQTPAEVDEDVCFICAEPITFWSVGVCGHRTCHVCAVRLRTFYKKNDCTFCKSPLPSLLFSRSPTAPFPSENHIIPSRPDVIAAAQAKGEKEREAGNKTYKWDKNIIWPGTLDLGSFPYTDEILNVVFEDEDMMEATLLLLRFNCPYQDCPYQAENWPSLSKHTMAVHRLSLCNLCKNQLSRFAHEQGLYPPKLLGLHDPSVVPRGQHPPRPTQEQLEMIKRWDAPHPMCEFCHRAFFGPDELFKHMRSAHEECHVCRGLGDKDVYFENYPKLEKHFNHDHYACSQPICVEKKFVVFGTDMDLKAHVIAEHSESMNARDRANARQIAVDFASEHRRTTQQRSRSGQGQGFTLAQPFNPSSGGPSRIRDTPSHQQLEQPNLTPAQQAQQHRQVQRDKQEENKRKRAFATGLTSSGGQAGVTPRGAVNESGPSSGFATPREDVDEATATRHAELLSRVSTLVNDSEIKLNAFRSAVRGFKNNESSAKDMLDTIYHVLDRDPEVTVTITRELGGLFSGEGQGDKERAILEALNAFRVEQREQFPSLSNNTPQGLGGNYAGITSGKILNAKRTTQSGGNRNSRSVWDRVEAAAASHPVNRPAARGTNGRYVPGSGAVASSSAFPTLGGPSAGPSKSGVHSTPWSAGGAGSSSKAPPALAGPQIRSVNFPTAKAVSKPKPLNSAAFPSLPSSSGVKGTTAADRKALFSKPTARDESIRRITGAGPPPPPAANGWGFSSATSGVESLSVADDVGSSGNGASAVAGGGGGGGKKKGKGKQLLFTVSARP